MKAPAETLPELLHRAAGSGRGVTFLDGARGAHRTGYDELEARARALLGHLQARGGEPGRAVVLLLADNAAFVDAFWACQLGGLVPVPVAVANTPANRLKLFRVWEALEDPLLCTRAATLERYGAFAAAAGEEARFAAMAGAALCLDRIPAAAPHARIQNAETDRPALIQFSSGSTRSPKGVILTHANLLTNIDAIVSGIGLGAPDVTLSWMPMTHDMGLIGFHLTPLACAIDHVLMPTDSFVRRPLAWLREAGARGATVLCSPNFGYRHLLRALDGAAPEPFDLSAVRLIFNGAEPISPGLCAEFLDRLAPFGLRREAMFPVYGLAEASLAVTFPAPGAPVHVRHIDRRTLRVGAPPAECPASDAHALALMGVGRPLRNCELAIRDFDGADLAPGTTGRILIRGAAVTSGYHAADGRLDRSAFSADGWLDTGDLGFLYGGDLFVAGRTKEIIFVNGQNLFPHDIEAVLHEHAGLEHGRVAACGAPADDGDGEQLLVFVVHRGGLEAFVEIARRVRRTLAGQLELAAARVLPVVGLPKTTSGKLQRYQLAQRYRDGEFADLALRLDRLEGGAAGGPKADGEVEAQILGICAACLPGAAIGADDNLLELGTGSLTLAQIYEQVDARYPGMLEITDFFEHPTPARLAARIRERAAGAAEVHS